MTKENHGLEKLRISDFKARCLKLLEETRRRGKSYLITKKGIAVARVTPVQKKRGTSRWGSLKGLAEIQGDIVHVDTSADWEVLKK
jgi:prevent-host-death family protein